MSPPTTRRAACREEVCVRLGYCGGDGRWSDEEDFAGETPDEVVDSVLAVEGLDSSVVPSGQHSQLRELIVAWLFDPHGKGEASGLPR